jgi:hypothetical protein
MLVEINASLKPPYIYLIKLRIGFLKAICIV